MLEIVIGFILVALIVSNGYLLHRAQKAGAALTEYEDFHNNTLDRVREILTQFDTLIHHSDVLYADDNVKAAHDAMKEFFETLVSYHNAR